MTAHETSAVVVLTFGHPFEVQETVDQIQHAIHGGTSPHITLVTVTDAHGIQRKINAAQIVEFYDKRAWSVWERSGLGTAG
jgi:hypothetical protein